MEEVSVPVEKNGPASVAQLVARVCHITIRQEMGASEQLERAEKKLLKLKIRVQNAIDRQLIKRCEFCKEYADPVEFSGCDTCHRQCCRNCIPAVFCMTNDDVHDRFDGITSCIVCEQERCAPAKPACRHCGNVMVDPSFSKKKKKKNTGNEVTYASAGWGCVDSDDGGE